MAVAVTRLDLDASALRRAATRCRDAKAARRMLALALVLEGASREDAARHAGMDRQTLRDWVHRYNVYGRPPLCKGVCDVASILGSGCSRVSGLSRGLIAAGLDGRSASRAPIAEANSRFVL
jgi:Homeodomain-like domain